MKAFSYRDAGQFNHFSSTDTVGHLAPRSPWLRKPPGLPLSQKHWEPCWSRGAGAKAVCVARGVARVFSQETVARRGVYSAAPGRSLSLQASFFVVYNMVTTEVIAVFENTSDELLELFENFCDLFRNATLHSEVQFPCSASSNNFARQIQRR